MQQLTPLVHDFNLDGCWSAVIDEGTPGLARVNQPLTQLLGTWLAAHVTILCDTASFLLIIHDHHQKLAIPGRISPGTSQPYDIKLDGWPVNNSAALMAIVQKYL
ncbi:hypothetical protein [Lactiplantibacillus pentosus]|uniref:hypothetical protein n=1 Tax=Lactiplantibacillus pentosus TaxID=1589 RepID=UPI0021A643ED|nr:hypothetical protein [Lactiplantibacillus pentosus]MCT3064729.1 hypothetical protein [Lactiplantibacillus pentosus]